MCGNKKKNSLGFDHLFALACGYIPIIGGSLSKFYLGHPLFQRFMKYGGWIAFQFWLLRAPLVLLLMKFLPESIGLILFTFPGYILADFVAGSILAVGGFFLSEHWIWRRRKSDSA